MLDICLRLIRCTTGGSAIVAGMLVIAPEILTETVATTANTTDPLEWAYIAVVSAVLGMSGYVVRFVLTRGVKALDKLTQSISELTTKVEILIASKKGE
jgi:hypothetical protein